MLQPVHFAVLLLCSVALLILLAAIACLTRAHGAEAGSSGSRSPAALVSEGADTTEFPSVRSISPDFLALVNACDELADRNLVLERALQISDDYYTSSRGGRRPEKGERFDWVSIAEYELSREHEQKFPQEASS